MTDNYEQQRTYTEEEVFQLLQRFRNEEKLIQQQIREDRSLPVDISSFLEESTQQQIQENFKRFCFNQNNYVYNRFKRDLSKYHDERWTVGEEINKSLLPKLKNFTVDTYQVVNSIYKGSEVLRTQGRADTELFEQLATLQEGDMSQDEAKQLLTNSVEQAKRLAIFAWYHAKQQDAEAKEYATKALRLPASLKHLEAKDNGKKEAFSIEFIEQYNEATYQQRVLRAATGGNSSNGNGRTGYSNHWQYQRGGRGFQSGGKNYFGGRGRGTPTFHSYNSHNHQQSSSLPQTGNPEQKQ